MKKTTAFILLCVFVLSFASCAAKPTEVDTSVGDGLFSSFSAVDTDGNIVDQSIFRDHKVTMINVWGTFCGPCIREMPDLAEISSEYAGRGVQIVGIPTDVVDRNLNKIPDKIDEMNEIIRTTGAGYRHLIPSKSLNDAFLSSLQSVPATVFVNENGCIIGNVYMGAKNKAEWESIINSILESVK